MRLSVIRDFIKHESTSSLVLLIATCCALILANSIWQSHYLAFLGSSIDLHFDNLAIKLSVKQIVNEGLMALFFLLVSLEVKREILIGELSTFKSALLPLVAAFGGMIFPALIFILCNVHYPSGIKGW